jgi:hypothetical protein
MLVRTLKWIAVFSVCCVLCVHSSWAQRTAGLTGVATDSTGAVVNNVKITVTQQLTGVTNSTLTDDSGVYQFVELDPGPYSIKASRDGFETSEARADLDATHVATVDLVLKVGSATTVVNINAQAAALDRESETVGSEIPQQLTENLPVLARNAYAMLPLMLGYSTPWKTSGDPAFAGGIPGSTAYYVDGSNALDSRVQTGNFISPASLEDINDVQVVVNDFKAEYGENGGAVVMMTTKSGTNQFHGSVFEFFQSDALDADNYFVPFRTPLLSHDFGVDLGGPILKNKLHFYFSYEGLRSHSTNTVAGGGGGGASFETVPTAAERTGDFTQLYNSAGTLVPIYDPRSTVVQPDGSVTRTQFSCNGVANVICPNLISPIAQQVMSWEPLPNNTPADPSGTNDYFGITTNMTTWNKETVRIDYDPTNRDKISGRFMWLANLGQQFGPWPQLPTFHGIKYATIAMNPADPTESVNPDYEGNVAFSWTRTITPTLVSDFHFGTAVESNIDEAPSAGLNFPEKLGLPVPTLPDPEISTIGLPNNHFPSFQGGPYTLPGANVGAGQVLPFTNSPTLIETVSKLHNRHSIKGGIEFKFSYTNRYNRTNSSGSYQFSPGPTSSSQVSTTSGNSLASLLVDYPSGGSLQDDEIQNFRTNYYGMFIQDDWKATRDLNLSVGVRYEIDTPLTETKNRINGFDPTAINPVSNTPGVITFPNANFPSSQYHNVPINGFANPEYNEVQPRVGFAYSLDGGKSVVRGGFGIYFNEFQQLDIWSIPATDRPDVDHTENLTSPDGIAAPFFLATGLPPLPNPALVPGYGAVAPNSAGQFSPQVGVTFIPRNNKSGYQEDTELSVEHEFWNTAAELGYMGNFGHRLAVCNGGYGCDLALNVLSPAQLLTVGPVFTQKDLPFPQFTYVNELNPSIYNSSYHAMYVQATHRETDGLTFMTHFTWSKAMNDYSSGNGEDLYDVKNGLSYTHRKFQYVFAGTYALPAGRGRRYLTSGPLSYALGGWRISPALNVESGQPMAAFLSGVPGASYPNCIGNPNSGPKRLNDWFNLAAFSTPAPYSRGNCPENVIIGPGWLGLDTSLQKDFPIWPSHEDRILELRLDNSNSLNHPNWTNPSSNICPADNPCTTNLITGAWNPRQTEISLRLKY